jgi:hypothetical protein
LLRGTGFRARPGVKVRRAALIAAAVATVAGCAPAAVAAPASPPAWHIVKRVAGGSNGVFTAVTAVGSSGGWAFEGYSYGVDLGAWQYNGRTWSQVASGHGLEGGSGPLAILHWNGSVWSKVAGGSFGFGTLQQFASDGHGGLWLPMPGPAARSPTCCTTPAGT